jgi:hypothetical protein
MMEDSITILWDSGDVSNILRMGNDAMFRDSTPLISYYLRAGRIRQDFEIDGPRDGRDKFEFLAETILTGTELEREK